MSLDAPPIASLERPLPHVALLRLNRPQARNAINGELARAIGDAVDEIEADASIRVSILASEGPVFCAGADLRDVAAGRGNTLSTEKGGFAGFVFVPRIKPWIAAVQGPAFGGGTELALACDMIVAGRQASFALPEVKRGVVAGAGGCFRLTLALPRALAIEMMLTGEPIDVARALAFGLVNRVVDGEPLAAALELAGAIARNSPLSVRESLAIARMAGLADEATILARQALASGRVMASPDLVEGATAFVEKRAPEWRT